MCDPHLKRWRALHKIRVQRHRDRRRWRGLRQRDGWRSVAELVDFMRDVRAAYVSRWELPDYLRKLIGRRDGTEGIEPEDVVDLPKKHIAERIEKITNI